MDAILGFFQNSLGWVIAVVAVIAIVLYVNFRYKIPNADQALVVTGGKNGLRVLPGRGAFISPFKKHQFFPLGVMTVRSSDQETQTSTIVPVIVQWTAQLRADVETEGALVKAVQGFSGYESPDEIADSLTRTLDGEVRAVVATMTPKEVVTDKTGFSGKVQEGVQGRMEDLGFKLVSLNIAVVTDNNKHYHNLAAEDREEQRRAAEKLTANADKDVAVAQAEADQASKAAEQARDLAVADQRRELALRQSAIKVETDQAEADAAIAGQLQTELRNQDLEARKGEVEVIREQQRQASAAARRDVELTEAETAKQKLVIDTEAEARKAEIDAAARAAVNVKEAEGTANAEAARAEGAARAAKAEAQGKADATNLITEARATEIRETGKAEAEATQARGEAEAAAILARGEAEAEAQLKMAAALAANDGANLQVTLAQIQRDTTVTVSSALGQTMAHIGENATFIDMGGSSNGGDDLLSKILGNVPKLLAQLNVQSTALNGAPFGESIGSVISAISGKSPGDEPEAAATEVVVPGAVEEEASPLLLDEASVDAVAARLGVEPSELGGLVSALLTSATKRVADPVTEPATDEVN